MSIACYNSVKSLSLKWYFSWHIFCPTTRICVFQISSLLNTCILWFVSQASSPLCVVCVFRNLVTRFLSFHLLGKKTDPGNEDAFFMHGELKVTKWVFVTEPKKKKLGPRKQDHTLMKSNIPSETKLRNMVFSAFSEYLAKRFLYSLPTLIVGSRSTEPELARWFSIHIICNWSGFKFRSKIPSKFDRDRC